MATAKAKVHVEPSPLDGLDRETAMDREQNGWYKITPAWAQTMLDDEDRPKNRVMREGRVKRVADEIARGEWVPNGESIVLDQNGKLIDGQNRLRACVLAEKPIVAYIVHLPRKASIIGAFDTIDRGVTRSLADRMSIDGIPYYLHVASLCRLIWMWENGYSSKPSGGHTVTPKDIRKVYDADPKRIQYAAEMGAANIIAMRGWLKVSQASFVYYMASKQDKEAAHRWFESLITGANLSPTNPVMHLRKRLLEVATSKVRLQDRETLALLIRTWVYYRDKRQIKNLKWNSSSAFPSFDDVAE